MTVASAHPRPIPHANVGSGVGGILQFCVVPTTTSEKQSDPAGLGSDFQVFLAHLLHLLLLKAVAMNTRAEVASGEEEETERG